MTSEIAQPAKTRSRLVRLALPVLLLGIGAGGAYGMVAAGLIGPGRQARADNLPRLILKGTEDPFAPKAETDKAGEGAAPEIEGDGGSRYRTSYFTFADEFTSNLRNSDGLIQVSLAASTHRDGRVLLWLKKHELAVRSALLGVLADTPEEDAYSLAGKQRLQQRLTGAINKVLTDTEGFGGVDAVYFKSYLIQ